MSDHHDTAKWHAADSGPLFACDLAIAADEAQFALSEINWGILPGGGATKVITELVPLRDAMYHALTGESLDNP